MAYHLGSVTIGSTMTVCKACGALLINNNYAIVCNSRCLAIYKGHWPDPLPTTWQYLMNDRGMCYAGGAR